MDVVRGVEAVGSQSGKPKRPVVIQNCGVVKGQSRANMYTHDKDRAGYRRSRSRSPIKEPKGPPRSKIELENARASGQYITGSERQDPIKQRVKEIRDGSGNAGAPRRYMFDDNGKYRSKRERASARGSRSPPGGSDGNWKTQKAEDLLKSDRDGYLDREGDADDRDRVSQFTSSKK